MMNGIRLSNLWNPIPPRVHFKDLVMYNYTQLEVQEGITEEEQR